MARVKEVSKELGIYLVNSVNPFRLEGQKTIMFRVLEGLGWQVPDWIVVPGGNLGNSSAFGKAFAELHELGLIDRRYAPAGAPTGPAGEVVFWHVDDLTATVARLLSLGAKEYEPITERGEGFVTASVVDPFGNILGVMYNAHYLEVLGKTGGV